MATKKVSSPKATKAKGDKKKSVKVVQPDLVIKLVSYTVEAIIPTMMYGNITPKITVEARTMEDAKLAVMPHIEELYNTYAVEPMDGRKPAFMSKASVTATERVVPQNVPGKAVDPIKPVEKPTTPTPTPTAPKSELDALAEDLKTSPAYDKALSAIKNSMSKDALGLIEEQIQKSTRLTESEKPLLLSEVLKKRKEFN